MSRKLRLGLDLDGVIYRWSDTVRYLLETYWNLKNVPFEGRIEQHIPKEVNDWVWKEGVEKHGLFRYGSIYKGSREFLDTIQDQYNIVVLTRRPPNALRDTLDWLAYQHLPAAEIHVLDWKTPKSSIQPQCDVYLDDEIGNAQDFIENTKALVIMPDREWNQGYYSDEITRFHRGYSWAHIKYILETYHMQVNRDEQRIEAI